MNDIMTVQLQKGLLPHCETTMRNSDCPYISKGCTGCMHPKNRTLQESLLAVVKKYNQSFKPTPNSGQG